MHHRSLSPGFVLVAFGVLWVLLLVVSTLVARRRGFAGLGANTLVRCRRGHLFTTIWVPGASVKAVRLGGFRFQHCPVGAHWALVKPVNESTLTEDERRLAATTKDLRIP